MHVSTKILFDLCVLNFVIVSLYNTGPLMLNQPDLVIYIFSLDMIGTLSKINVIVILAFSDRLVDATSDCGTAVIMSPNMDFIL